MLCNKVGLFYFKGSALDYGEQIDLKYIYCTIPSKVPLFFHNVASYMGMIPNTINDITIWTSNPTPLGLNPIHSKTKTDFFLIKGAFLKYCRALKERYV